MLHTFCNWSNLSSCNMDTEIQNNELILNIENSDKLTPNKSMSVFFLAKHQQQLIKLS